VPAAVACLACGWFFLSLLRTDLGAAQLQFHFYDVLTLMRSPGRITTGLFGEEATRDAWLFGAVCVLALLAALAPTFSGRKAAWLGCVAPLALMILCGAILYHVLSRELVPDNGWLGSGGLRIGHFANRLADRLGAVVSRRVQVGLGGYLALAASAFLAIKGFVGYRHAP
jgi:hypothetical protein